MTVRAAQTWGQEQSEHAMVTLKTYHTKAKKESKAMGDRKIIQATENITWGTEEDSLQGLQAME